MTLETANDFINNLPIGVDVDVKLGLSTRSVCKIKNDEYELTDLIDGWLTAIVNEKTLIEVLTGDKSLIELNWK